MRPLHAPLLTLSILFILALPRAGAADPHGYSWKLHGTPTELYGLAPGEEFASFAEAHAIDLAGVGNALSTRRVFVGFSQNADSSTAAVDPALLVSDNAGATFFGHGPNDPDFRSVVRLDDGTMISVGFVPDTAIFHTTSATLRLERSSDRGKTWTRSTASLELGGGLCGLRMHKGIIALPTVPETLLMPYITLYDDSVTDRCAPPTDGSSYDGDLGRRVEIATSTDGGATWTRRGTIAVSPRTGFGYSETALVVTSDGSLLAVMRTEVDDQTPPIVGKASTLTYSRSADGGRTWSAPQELQIPFEGAPAAAKMGVDPTLVLLPNGVLVLSSGRYDNWIAISRDGTGRVWEQARVTYQNFPRGLDEGDLHRDRGSSGYTGLASVASNRLVHVGDNCANSWGCNIDASYLVDRDYRIWRVFVDVLTPDVGKIDLASKLAKGRIHLDTNMRWSHPQRAEVRPAGALDGSTDSWASAVKARSIEAPYYHLALDRTYELTRVGLSLHRGVEAEADVFVSEDGQSWTRLFATGKRKDWALRYTDISPPVRARHVKVVGSYGATCGAALPQGCAMLNELELYSTFDSFENDALHAAPRGYEDNVMTWTTESVAHDSRRTLLLWDSKTVANQPRDATARIRREMTPAAAKTLEFRLYPLEMPNSFLFGLEGNTGNADKAYHLAALPDGSFDLYEPATNSWGALTASGLFGAKEWIDVKLVASASSATLCVNGANVATFSSKASAFTSLSAFYFSSAGTAALGKFAVDDVRFVDGSEPCADAPVRVDAGVPDGFVHDLGQADAGIDGSTLDMDVSSDGSVVFPDGRRVNADEGCSCEVGSTPPSWAFGLLALALVVMWRRRG